jgi:SAM-dependent methyltransferase
MPGFMNPAEFANIAGCERDFWWYRGMREIFSRSLDGAMEGRPVRRAIEAGCGAGYFSRLLQTERGWPVVPVDISWDGLAYARRLGVERPVQADICILPFAPAAFDLVLSVDVLQHLPPGAESLAVSEFARVLAPGGLLVARPADLRVLRCTYVNSLLMPVALEARWVGAGHGFPAGQSLLLVGEKP